MKCIIPLEQFYFYIKVSICRNKYTHILQAVNAAFHAKLWGPISGRKSIIWKSGFFVCQRTAQPADNSSSLPTQ